VVTTGLINGDPGALPLRHLPLPTKLDRGREDLLRMHQVRLIRLKRIYNFLCSMLVFTPFALCFVTLRGVFMRFSELTY
jgi:hypothetical protein